MSCEGLLTGDLGYDCENGSIGGLETNVVVINSEDIDISAQSFDPANEVLMTGFALKSGKTGFTFKGVKQTNSTSSEFIETETSDGKFKHTFNGIILTMSAANKLQLQKMKRGNFVVIVEKKWKGASNADAFDVFGLRSGLVLKSAVYNSNENDGTGTIELSSADGYEEPKIHVNLLITDYTATKAAFDNKFIEA